MIKKSLYIIICFVCVFMFNKNVIAVEDVSLDSVPIYDIESANVSSDGIMTLKGWAFNHGLENVGTDYFGDTYDGMYKSPASKNMKIEIYFGDLNGNKNLGDVGNFNVELGVKLDNKTVDLTDWMCNRTTDNLCASGNYIGNLYYNLGFEASINLNSIRNSISNTGTYYLWLSVNTGGTVRRSKIAIDTYVYSNTDPLQGIKVEGMENTVYIIANYGHLLGYCGGYSTCGGINNFYIYWTKNKSYELKEIKKAEVNGGYTKYRYPVRLFKLPYKDSYYYASSSWATINGSVYITFTNSDKVCSVSNSSSDTCLDNGFSYLCNEMTVYATTSSGQEVSAIVSLSESADLDFGDDYYKNTIYAGGGFKFNLTYTDTASWNYKSRSYGSLSQDEGDRAIASKMKDYYNGLTESTLENFIINNSITGGDIGFNEAGSWECNSVGSFSSGTITTTCNYNLKEAFINYSTGFVSYGNNTGSVVTGGQKFYIPLKYTSNKFKWNITSTDLSTLRVRNVKNNKNSAVSLNWKVDTSGNLNNMCYVNVKNYYYNVEGDPDNGKINGYKFIYRSIDVSDPFPNIRVSDYPANWKQYYDSVDNLNRVTNSFKNSAVYVTDSLDKNLVNKLNGLLYDYTSWEDINNNGISNLIKDTYFSVISRGNNVHCNIGEYRAGCDSR